MSTEWLVVVWIAHLGIALVTCAHALLHKHDPRSAWSWMLACSLLPILGVLLYGWFGINRIERRARREIGEPASYSSQPPDAHPSNLAAGATAAHAEMIRMGRAVSGRSLVARNRVEILHDGDQAFPAMLAAIEGAKKVVWLISYLFDDGTVGRCFAEALSRAVARGVEVRVLLDGVGDLVPGIRGSRLLKRHGVPVRLFLPPRLFPPLLHINLRNHRKLLCIDGGHAFLGGMNIGDHQLLASWSRFQPRRTPSRMPAADLHFRVEGEICAQLRQVFIEDWQASGGEHLTSPSPEALATGSDLCRVITDGPNAEVGRLQMLILGALASAHRQVCIMTPYFIPTPELSAALQTTAMRGVNVTLLVPERGDHPWLDAASRRWLAQLIERGVHVHLRPPPFAHSKLILIDDRYALIGSANLDPRSLRLNFELMMEVYSDDMATTLHRHFQTVLAASPRLSGARLRRRSLAARLFDSTCWLLSPYL